MVLASISGCYFLIPKERRILIRTISDFVYALLVRVGIADSQHLEREGIPPQVYSRLVMRRFQTRLKIYVVMWQILSILPFCLDLQFPNVYSAILASLSVLNLDVSRSSLITCPTHTSYDAIDALVVDTTYPIGVTLLLGLASLIHSRILHHRIAIEETSKREVGTTDLLEVRRLRSNYYKLFLLFTFLILPSVSSRIF